MGSTWSAPPAVSDGVGEREPRALFRYKLAILRRIKRFKRIWPFDDEPGVPADGVVGAEQEQGRRPGGRVRLLVVVMVVMVVGPWPPHAGGCSRRPDAVTSRGRSDFLLRRQPIQTANKTSNINNMCGLISLYIYFVKYYNIICNMWRRLLH